MQDSHPSPRSSKVCRVVSGFPAAPYRMCRRTAQTTANRWWWSRSAFKQSPQLFSSFFLPLPTTSLPAQLHLGWIHDGFSTFFFISLRCSQECVQVAKDRLVNQYVLLPWQHMVRQWSYQSYQHVGTALYSTEICQRGTQLDFFFLRLESTIHYHMLLVFLALTRVLLLFSTIEILP